jgi:predicted AlkP superfamily phosphohydrolase/phosphomutase
MTKNKVYVLGIDGGSFALLDRWLQEGELPHLQAIMANGVSGELESSLPPVTAPAWTSFMTGKNPDKHGVYDFMLPAEQSYAYYPINAYSRRGKALWEIISEVGRRVAVLNVPTTYPPRPVNGVLISDFLTPSGKRDFTYPQSLLEELA